MPESKLINIAGLQRAAEFYDNTLRKLPYYDLQETVSALKLELIEVHGTDKRVLFHRKGGLARPYVAGASNDVLTEEIGKIIERKLETKECYIALKDHIMNYKEKKVVSNAGEKVDNQTKKHALELELISTKVATVGEDIIDALFHASRDDNDKSPMGMFDGINTQIDNEITAGEVSLAKGNLAETGPISEPADKDDIEAFDKLITFVRSASPFLRRRGILYITNNALFHCMDALGNKLKYKNAMEFEVFLEHIRGLTQSPNLNIITHESLGSGSRLLYTVENNLHLGLGTRGDEQFVQVRSPYEDPNIVQFWMQWAAGTRIESIHPKTFLVNDQVNISTELSGDYS